MKTRYHRGDLHPVTGLVFENYMPSCINGEHWVTKEHADRITRKAREVSKAKFDADPASYLAKNARWRNNNRERYRAQMRRATGKRRSTPLGRLICNMRSRVSGLISGSLKMSLKDNPLGCTMEQLRSHLEKHFLEGMSWENYGGRENCWSLDHTVPLSFAKTEEELIKLLHYSNLRPLWHLENVSKNNRRAQILISK